MKLFSGKLAKKAQALATLQALLVGLAVIAMVLAICFVMLAKTKAQIVSIDNVVEANQSQGSGWSVGYNATRTITEAVADVPGWLPLIVIAIIGVAVLGVMSLYQRSR